MGRTTIYQYFKNKDEIFYCTIGDFLEELKVKVEAIVSDQSLTFIEKLKKLVFELVNEYEYNNIFVLLMEMWIILKRENNKLLEMLKSYTQELKIQIKNLISQGIAANEIKPIDSESMADTIYSFIESFTLQSVSNNIDKQRKLSSLNILIDGLRV
jgi:AcrR family transcriptional regulator